MNWPEPGMHNGKSLIPFLQLRWLGRERIVAYSCILALVSLVSFYWTYRDATGETGSDFLAFWSAGKLVVAGAASTVYDTAATYAVQATLGRDEVFAFVNPPPFLLLVWPFGYLPFNLAWILWIVATFTFWFVTSRRFVSGLSWPVLAFPGALVGAWHAQTGLLTSGFQEAAANLLLRRPLVAGFCIGALIIKPHLAVLFPVALAAGKHWRAFGAAAVSVVALFLVTWLAFGTDTILNYRQSWPVSQYLMDTGDADFFLRQVTIYAALRVVGPAWLATIAQALTTLAVAVLTWRVWSGKSRIEGKLAFLFAATPLATPYLFSYDLPFLILPICWLIGEARVRPGGAWERPMLLFFYLSPLVARAAALPLGANITPWVQVWMLWVIWRRLASASG